MTKPPCKVDGIECPRRYIGCRAECEEYHKWVATHAREKARERMDKQNEADTFLIERKTRKKQERGMEHMRGYVRK